MAKTAAREAILYVPAAVIWEVTLLARGGRINLRRTVRSARSGSQLNRIRDLAMVPPSPN